MDLTAIFGIISFMVKEFPKVQTVVSDVVGMVKGTAPANHPNTGAPAGKPNDTIRALQKLYNEYFKPAKPIQEDGLFGKESEGAVRDALGRFGLKI